MAFGQDTKAYAFGEPLRSRKWDALGKVMATSVDGGMPFVPLPDSHYDDAGSNDDPDPGYLETIDDIAEE